jgi:phosphatidylserine decarboxylase
MRYKDRTGKEVCANGQQDALLQKMYGTALGRKLLSVLVQPAVSKIVGYFMDSRLSTVLIPPFVQKNRSVTI